MVVLTRYTCCTCLNIASWQTSNQFGQCRWSSDSRLVISLGLGVTIIPGASLALKDGALRSKNRVSLPSTSVRVVQVPVVTVRPTVSLRGAQVCFSNQIHSIHTFLTLERAHAHVSDVWGEHKRIAGAHAKHMNLILTCGSQIVDACTPLVIQDSTSRTRSATYTWSSTNTFLQSVASAVSGPRFEVDDTSSLPADTPITIRVTVVDVFGISSTETSLTVTRQSSPVPKVRACVLVSACVVYGIGMRVCMYVCMHVWNAYVIHAAL
jgi:hypothetical protein